MAVTNPFLWATNRPQVDTRDMQTEAKLKAVATKRVAARRAAGDPNVDIRGTSRRADEILRTRKSFSIEGREAGQRSADKRDALKRGGR